MTGKIAFQGERGANSEIACLQAYPHLEALPCRTFEDVFAAVENEVADLAMIPVEKANAAHDEVVQRLIPPPSNTRSVLLKQLAKVTPLSKPTST